MCTSAETGAATSTGPVTEAFRQSRCFLIVVFAAAVAIGGLSFCLFAYQIQVKNEVGSPSYRDPYLRRHLLGHALRTLAGTWVALALWGHFRGTKLPQTPTNDDLLRVAESLKSVWKSMAVSIVILAIYSVGVTVIPVRTMSEELERQSQTFPVARSPDAQVEFRLAEESEREGLTKATVESSGDVVYLYSEPALTNSDIARADVTVDEDGYSAVTISIAPEAQFRMRRLTSKNRGRRLAILIDQKLLTAPIIRWEIGESAMITGRFTPEEAQRIADSLNNGRLEEPANSRMP